MDKTSRRADDIGAQKGAGMKMAIVVSGLLASLAMLGAIPANDPQSGASGGFSVWAQAQQPTGYCECLDANTRGISCKPVTSCLATGECQKVCPKPI
jgi:hypothetical protein